MSSGNIVRGQQNWTFKDTDHSHNMVHTNTSRHTLRWRTVLQTSFSYHQLRYCCCVPNREPQETYRLLPANQIINTRKMYLLPGMKQCSLFSLEARRGGMKAAGSSVMVLSRSSSQRGTAVCCVMHRMVLVDAICPLLFNSILHTGVLQHIVTINVTMLSRFVMPLKLIVCVLFL